MKLTEDMLRSIIKESIGGMFGQKQETDIQHTLTCAKEDLDKAYVHLTNAQAMAYNFGMEAEANAMMEAFSNLYKGINEKMQGMNV